MAAATPPTDGSPDGTPTTSTDVASTVRSKGFALVLALSAVVGVLVSLLAWGFLQLVHQIQQGVFTGLPKDLGYAHGAPLWWSLPALAIAGALVAVAIVRLPGRGGNVPADGLHTGMTQPVELPGVLLAAFATLGLGAVLGPEAPLIALGGASGILFVRLLRRDAPQPLVLVVAASATFAAVSMIFDSPLIAAVILIEATGLGGARLPLVIVPGLLAAGIGSLISIGMGSWTGLSSSSYAIGALSLPAFGRPTAAQFGWTLAFAVAVAVAGFAIIRLGRLTDRVVAVRPALVLPPAGLVIAGLAIAFSQAAGKPVSDALFSGQSALSPLVSNPGAWSLSALTLLIAFKGAAWGISLGGFRGGPTFPAIFLGAAGGLMAAHLPGFSLTPAVAVGIGAAVVTVLRLPLSAVVLAVLLTSHTGAGSVPLVIVGTVAAYVTTVVLNGPRERAAEPGERPTAPAERPVTPAAPRPPGG